MLRIYIPEQELWDEQKECFVYFTGRELQLEHSLFSISKWESKWHKPYMSKIDRTNEETIDYIKCMSMTDIDDFIISLLSKSDIDDILAYINDSMTATTFPEEKKSFGYQRPITNELIYYWMVTYNIPFECEHWHLNRLLTLIKVCKVENSEHKPMSNKELLSRNAKLNAERRARTGSKG